ncbi:unnamed protein product [Sphagnum balticum]
MQVTQLASPLQSGRACSYQVEGLTQLPDVATHHSHLWGLTGEREKWEHWPADFFNPALGRKDTVPRGRLADPRAPVSRALNDRRISRRIPPGDMPPPRGRESPRGGSFDRTGPGEGLECE